MSWQLASFAIVLGCLALAFWWYEHSRPSAKLLAVIGTLAALAALGRDAFAAVPDVKPITAIVLVGGLAFGAGPGFAIGAISGLASNILLGQGPWTPWQMLGWGLVGLFGALLGRLGGRRLPPLGIALACAVSAELFNLVLDLYTWTGTASHSFTGFGLVLGSALVFDLTHVIASFAFGLLFGTVLLRMLIRVRSRMQVQWLDAEDRVLAPAPRAGGPAGALALAGVAGLLVIALLAVGLAHHDGGGVSAEPARSVSPEASASVSGALTTEISYLSAAQAPNGGFGSGPGLSSSELYSAWVAIGLAAAGRDPLSVQREGHSVLDALRSEAGTLSGAGDLERTILALHACGVSVHSLPGGDPVARLLHLRAGDGSFGHLSNLTAFAILALRAAGYPDSTHVLHAAVAWLLRQQNNDGGFGFGARPSASDIDDTGAVLEALGAAGVPSSHTSKRAVSYLLAAQNLDGGFPQEPHGNSNAQSTAWAVQGLLAVHHSPASVHRRGSRTPIGYLKGLIAPDGSVRYSASGSQTPVWVTAEALAAFAGKPLPVAPLKRPVVLSRR
jgi:energy-coupling factor transport system substrate-specific component